MKLLKTQTIFLKQQVKNNKLFVCGNWNFIDAQNKEVNLKKDCEFKDLLFFQSESEAMLYQNKINSFGYNFKLTLI
jgi:hypothetical protein